MSAPTCASVRPGLEELAHPGVHPVDRRARGAQLRPPRRRPCASAARSRIGPARDCAASGSASRSPNTCFAGIASATASRVGPPARSLTSRYGSSPSFQVTTSTPSSSSGSVGPARGLQPRHDQRGRRAVPGRGQHEAGQPLVARAVRVEEVAQVGARGDQQQVDAVVGGDVARPPDAVGEQRGGNGRSRVARSHVAQYAPTPCVIPATRPPVGNPTSRRAPRIRRHTPDRTAAPRTAAAAVVRARATPGRRATRDRAAPRAAALAHCGTVARPLMLLDAASLYFRAFYGVPESITAPDGTPVNAVRGFCDMVVAAAHRASPGAAGGVPGPGLAPGVPGGGAALVQGAPGGGRTPRRPRPGSPRWCRTG